MRPIIPIRWHGFSEDLEGRTTWPYLCTAEKVTVGVGNMIEPLSTAQALPWQNTATGMPATRDEVAVYYAAVKSRTDLARLGGGHFRNVSPLRLTEADVDRLVARKLAEVDRQMAGMFPAWDSWPADGQLALLSWAWAVGGASPYPRMFAALRAGDWLAAAEEAEINPKIGTIIKRNARNRILLRNASVVVHDGLDPGVIYWPRDLLADATPTLPALNEDDGEGTPTKTVPEMRPPPSIDRVVIIHPDVPLGRPALDDPEPDPEGA